MRCTFKPYEGPEKYIFVSYSHRDGEIIAGILEALNEKGFRIWYDEGIEWGTEWPESIAKHLHGCAVVIAFHSKTSITSRNCRQEINYALKCGKDILSVYLEEAELSKGMDMQLSSYQSTYPYQYTNQEEFYMRLIKEPLIQNCRSDREAAKQPDDLTTQQSVSKVQPILSSDMKIDDDVLVNYGGSGENVVIPVVSFAQEDSLTVQFIKLVDKAYSCAVLYRKLLNSSESSEEMEMEIINQLHATINDIYFFYESNSDHPKASTALSLVNTYNAFLDQFKNFINLRNVGNDSLKEANKTSVRFSTLVDSLLNARRG